MPAAPRPHHRAPEDGPAPGAALLGADADLTAAVLRLAEAAGCTVLPEPPTAAGGVPARIPPLLLVGAGTPAHRVAEARARGAAEVVLVGRAPVDPQWWRHAAEVDADHAALLPEAEPWLVDRLVDAAGGPRPEGRVVGVVGGCGGGGASVLAAALAAAAAPAGDALLLDADPASGGLDLLLGADQLPGLRWGDLAGVSGRLRPDVLRSTVRLEDGLHLLAGDRRTGSGPTPEALTAVLRAARSVFTTTVVDLPRGRLDTSCTDVLGACGEVLVVAPATTRAAASACCTVDEVRRLTGATAAGAAPEVRLVLRDVGAGTDAEALADVVGAPLAAVLRGERDLETALERGEGLPTGRRSAVRAFAARWAAATAGAPVAAVAAVPSW
ncbi:septum site-determining protein Ssd [Kineococcus auxinigenes]|uniref:septum site-determining protein Ssd n=1 Tax=unclassified Kineococcus TaxID=2621656 RepID=UPI003D7E70A8